MSEIKQTHTYSSSHKFSVGAFEIRCEDGATTLVVRLGDADTDYIDLEGSDLNDLQLLLSEFHAWREWGYKVRLNEGDQLLPPTQPIPQADGASDEAPF